MTTHPEEFDQAPLQPRDLREGLQGAQRELQETQRELQETQSELQKAQRELEQAMQLRDEFMSIVSHELRTPLNTMKLELYARRIYLEKGDPDAFTPKKIAAMVDSDERQIDRLVRLINAMMDVSRIRHGQLSLCTTEVDLAALVQSLMAQFDAQIRQANCAVRLHSTGDTNARVDAFKIEQVLVNLLTNALRHCNAKPIDIHLEDLGDKVRIEVRDYGPGIQPEDHQRIFQVFERKSNERKSNGLGLGLFIAHQIVIAHGGQLNVNSVPGEGASFFLLLPKAPALDDNPRIG